MAQDWKDLLAGIRGDVPQVAEEVHETTKDLSEGKPASRQSLRIIIDRKGRKGKTATIIEGFDMSEEEVAEIASELKRKIGTGGSARGGEILLQGEWKEKAASLLREKGYKICLG